MTIYVGNVKVSANNHCDTKNLVTFETLCKEMHRLLSHFENDYNAKAILKQWCSDTEERRYSTFKDLAHILEKESLMSRSREGYYFQRVGESTNIAKVIHIQIVPNRSIGWDHYKFFQNLGHPDNQRWSDDQVSSRDLAKMLQDAFIKCDSDIFD